MDYEKLNDNNERDPRLHAIPDIHGHAKGEHKPYAEERPLPLTARMLFLWFYHACRRGYPRFLMVADHMNYLTFEDPAAVNLVRRALKLAQAGDLYGAAETANVDVGHAAVVSEGLRRGMRYSIGAEVDNDPRSRPDAQNIVDAMRPDAMIRSVHFIPITHPVHGENWNWPFDNPEFRDLFDVVGTEKTWELYIATLVDAIERLPGHIIGHFFVPAVFGHWADDATLEQYEDRVLDAAAARGMAIEFNTRFLYRDHTDEEKRRYLEANKRLLRKAKERGVGIAIGSDAHSPKDQARAFETVLNVLDELDINEIVFPLGGLLRRVALRVVREPEPEPLPAPAPAPIPEPAKAEHSATSVEDEAAAVAEPVKPVRKARPSAKPARPADTAPERPPERPAAAALQPPPEDPALSDVAGPSEPAAAVEAPATPSAPKAKPAVKVVAAKAPVPKGTGANAKAKPKATTPVKKAAPTKANAKKASPGHAAAKKAAPAKKSAPAKKAPAKKATTPARATAKKAAPKKATAKKAAPARSAPARKTSAAKKTAKKTATKRR